MADDIKGAFYDLPMEQLIGAPLKAVCESQQMLAAAALDFINKIGFDEKNKDQARLLKFKLERPVETPNGVTRSAVEVQAPFLGLVPLPSLLVEEVKIDFQMEVTATSKSKDTTGQEMGGSLTLGLPEYGLGISLNGKVTASRENTRETNQTGKYQVEVRARQQPYTEGMSKLMDILASCTSPLTVK